MASIYDRTYIKSGSLINFIKLVMFFFAYGGTRTYEDAVNKKFNIIILHQIIKKIFYEREKTQCIRMTYGDTRNLT